MAEAGSLHPFEALLASGFQGLSDGAWAESRDAFTRAVSLRDDPEALEGLGKAAWWLDDANIVFRSHERAFHLNRDAGDWLGAGRLATWIGLDHYLYRGHVAAAMAWMRRAHRFLDGVPPAAEHGWLMVWEAYVALMERNDVVVAIEAGTEAAGLAAGLGHVDLETLAIALAGLARVGAGEVDAGMRNLDEAAAVALSGEMTDLDAIVTTLCFVIYACERVRDFPRAVQWCDAVEDLSRRWDYRSMFGVCRCHHASVLFWSGDWTTAERELTMATPELIGTRPGWLYESIVRLAELRRRQGRTQEAAVLFGQAPTHPQSMMGLAEMALDTGDIVGASDLIDRHFRRVPAEDRTARAQGLETAVRLWLASGDMDRAQACVADLETTARDVGTSPLRAAASHSRGLVLAAAGDREEARRCLEDALDLYHGSGAPFETACVRIELARVLLQSGRCRAAEEVARKAVETFRQLGASGAMQRATSLLQELGITDAVPNALPGSALALTRRETEVLGLVARGLGNHEIAARLFISVRTVERHISNIYGKIGAVGSAARAIATVHAIEQGLVALLTPER